jgi:hypothetical protein
MLNVIARLLTLIEIDLDCKIKQLITYLCGIVQPNQLRMNKTIGGFSKLSKKKK